MQEALIQLISPVGLLLVLFGTALGIVVGAIPGLTGTMLIALTLPLTFGMDPLQAMILLISLYVGAISGGMITATLLRMPGTPASIVTTFDGYPLSQKGQSERALGLGVMASVFGGLVSCFFLFFLARPVANFSKSFGPFDYFSLVMMAMVLISTVGGKSFWRALFAGALGILLSMPGISPATGTTRLTLGLTSLNDGFQLLPVLIGLFAINQILRDLGNVRGNIKDAELSIQGVSYSMADLKDHGPNLLRSSLIGTWIGMLPGIGANIGAVTSYSVAKSVSKNGHEFGHGCEAGIVAAETANNATIGGGLIPLVAMGLPGSVVEAVLLGGLIVHGFQPGPRLFDQSPQLVYSIIFACLFATITMGFLMTFSIKHIARLARIPPSHLFPLILLSCVIGSFAIANRWFDVWVMLGFGVLGLGLENKNIPLAPLVIGFVLGPIAEENLSAGLMSSNGSWWPIIAEPLSASFLLVAIIIVSLPWLMRRRRRNLKVTE